MANKRDVESRLIRGKGIVEISPVSNRRIKDLLFIMDTNLLNTRGKDLSVNQLEKWFRDDVLKLRSTEELWKETNKGSAFFEKATQYPAVFGSSCCETGNAALREKIREIVFPNGLKSKNDRVDLEAIFVAKMTFAIFVTNDGDSKTQPNGILGSKDRLHREVGIQVMRPEEAVEIVKSRISLRDRMEMDDAAREGRLVSDWCGKD